MAAASRPVTGTTATRLSDHEASLLAAQTNLLQAIAKSSTSLRDLVNIYAEYVDYIKVYIEEENVGGSKKEKYLYDSDANIYQEPGFYLICFNQDLANIIAKCNDKATVFDKDFLYDLFIKSNLIAQDELTSDDLLPILEWFFQQISLGQLNKLLPSLDNLIREIGSDLATRNGKDENKLVICSGIAKVVSEFPRFKPFFFYLTRNPAIKFALVNIYYLEAQHLSRLPENKVKHSIKVSRIIFAVFKRLSNEEIKTFFEVLLRHKPLTSIFLSEVMTQLFNKNDEVTSYFNIEKNIREFFFPDSFHYNEAIVMITHNFVSRHNWEAVDFILEIVLKNLNKVLIPDFLKKINFNVEAALLNFQSLERQYTEVYHNLCAATIEVMKKAYSFDLNKITEHSIVLVRTLKMFSSKDIQTFLKNLLNSKSSPSVFFSLMMSHLFDVDTSTAAMAKNLSYFCFPDTDVFNDEIIIICQKIMGLGDSRTVNDIIDTAIKRLSPNAVKEFLLAIQLDAIRIDVFITTNSYLRDAFGLHAKKTGAARQAALYDAIFGGKPSISSDHTLLKRWRDYYENTGGWSLFMTDIPHPYKRILARRIYELLALASTTQEDVTAFKNSQTESFDFALETTTTRNIRRNRFAELWEDTLNYVKTLPTKVSSAETPAVTVTESTQAHGGAGAPCLALTFISPALPSTHDPLMGLPFSE